MIKVLFTSSPGTTAALPMSLWVGLTAPIFFLQQWEVHFTPPPLTGKGMISMLVGSLSPQSCCPLGVVFMFLNKVSFQLMFEICPVASLSPVQHKGLLTCPTMRIPRFVRPLPHAVDMLKLQVVSQKSLAWPLDSY